MSFPNMFNQSVCLSAMMMLINGVGKERRIEKIETESVCARARERRGEWKTKRPLGAFCATERARQNSEQRARIHRRYSLSLHTSSLLVALYGGYQYEYENACVFYIMDGEPREERQRERGEKRAETRGTDEGRRKRYSSRDVAATSTSSLMMVTIVVVLVVAARCGYKPTYNQRKKNVL